jgi:spoIIIJ-associated protein
MTAYREFTGKTVEEALRQARDEFGVGLDELDFEILTPGSRGVLGMGAEPARIVAAPRSALGGSAPKREAAEQRPLPPREERPRTERGDRGDRGHDRPPRRDDRRDERPQRDEHHGRHEAPSEPRPNRAVAPAPAARIPGGPPGAPAGRDRRGGTAVSSAEAEMVVAARSLTREREELQAAEATPEALAAGKEILERLMELMGFDVEVVVETGETNRLDVVGVDDDEHEALGALIGRKGERLSALQHIVNLMLSRQMGAWTRVLVDVEGYRGRRERQLREIALRAADRVKETGKMLQLEPMPALERRWVHLALRGNPDVATQSIGEEPNRRIVLVPRAGI